MRGKASSEKIAALFLDLFREFFVTKDYAVFLDPDPAGDSRYGGMSEAQYGITVLRD